MTHTTEAYHVGGNILRTHLLLAEDEVVELLLQHLVGVVDQELFEVVVRENLEACRRARSML